MQSRHPATMAAQALGWIDESTKALIPPVHVATTFIRDPDNQYRAGFSYGRPTNPTFVQPGGYPSEASTASRSICSEWTPSGVNARCGQQWYGKASVQSRTTRPSSS